MVKHKKTKSKRQKIKEQRRKKQRNKKLTTIVMITGAALLVVALFIYPSIKPSLIPVGDIVEITPITRPLVDGTALGDPDAPVLVEVWEDFQCPACKHFTEDVESRIIENYVSNGKIRYVFHQFPFLDDRVASKESDQAANASQCAAEQERFWDYHDILFANWNSENAGAFSDNRLVAYAETLSLDINQFKTCFQENRYKEKIDEDLTAGKSAGVTGTPSVFVNGEILTPGYVPTYEQIAEAIEQELGSISN